MKPDLQHPDEEYTLPPTEALLAGTKKPAKPRQAKAFYAVIVVSMFVALALNLIGIEPVKFLILAAVLNGLAAPVLMAIVWWLARDKNLLGKWASPIWSKLLLGVATVAMGSLPLFWLLAK